MGTQEAVHRFDVYAPLAQLDRVFGYEPKGRGFESLTACQKKQVPFGICFFVTEEGIREGGAVVNDMPVAYQSREVTEPAGEKNPDLLCKSSRANARAYPLWF